MYIYTQSTFILAKGKGLLDLLQKSKLTRQVTPYNVGSNEISNNLIGLDSPNPDGRDTNQFHSPYSSTSPYLVGLNVIDNRVINGMDSVFYLNQTTIMANGAPVIVGTYFVYTEGEPGYFVDFEDSLPYYENTYQI